MASLPGSARRGRPFDPAVDEALLRAALDLVVDEGYDRLTTAAVARRAGASTASLYRRWPTKQDLVADVARALTADALDGIDTGRLEGDLRELVDRKRVLFARVGPALLALLAQAARDDRLRAVLREEALGAARSALAQILGAAARRGELATPPGDDELEVLALVLLGAGLAGSVLTPPDRADEVREIELALLLDRLRRS